MIKAKKSLGQNFLIDKLVLEKIVDTVKIENKHVIEIGPGTGNLTSHILKHNPKKLVVIEKDKTLANNLHEIFKNQITVINEDVLNINENLIFNEKATVFGNLPYNISTEILSKWILNLKDNFWFEALILMFQKEVADRIISNFNTPNYGRLSILSNWKLDIEKICDVKPNSFSPRPKVDSSLLFFTPKKFFQKLKEPKNLEKITRIFFRHRRKMIKKSFRKIFSEYLKISNKYKINLNLRPQNINFETYYKLTQEYEKLRG